MQFDYFYTETAGCTFGGSLAQTAATTISIAGHGALCLCAPPARPDGGSTSSPRDPKIADAELIVDAQRAHAFATVTIGKATATDQHKTFGMSVCNLVCLVCIFVMSVAVGVAVPTAIWVACLPAPSGHPQPWLAPRESARALPPQEGAMQAAAQALAAAPAAVPGKPPEARAVDARAATVAPVLQAEPPDA